MVLDQVRSNFEEPNSFVGRQRELAELSRLAASMRAVTLCGPGGIGKTRLALAADETVGLFDIAASLIQDHF